jgi:hypothetical protein
MTYDPFGWCPRTVSLDHMSVLFLAFCGLSKLLSTVVVLIAFPPTVYMDSCFATSLPAQVVITFDYGHSNWDEMKYKCCFDLHLFYNQGSWTHFHVFIGPLYHFKNFLFNSCAHFFIGCWFLVFSVPSWFRILAPYWMSCWQRFSPILWAVLYYLDHGKERKEKRMMECQ